MTQQTKTLKGIALLSHLHPQFAKTTMATLATSGNEFRSWLHSRSSNYRSSIVAYCSSTVTGVLLSGIFNNF
jgi:hypothetical protein